MTEGTGTCRAFYLFRCVIAGIIIGSVVAIVLGSSGAHVSAADECDVVRHDETSRFCLNPWIELS